MGRKKVVAMGSEHERQDAGGSVWERKKLVARGSQHERYDGRRVSEGKEKVGS